MMQKRKEMMQKMKEKKEIRNKMNEDRDGSVDNVKMEATAAFYEIQYC